jgi:branched-chain amino acid transport system substrate-binding protein
MPRMRIGLASVAAVALLALAGCGSSSNSSSSGGGGSATSAATSSAPAGNTGTSGGSTGTTGGGTTAAVSSCGTKPGVKATGTPIPIGTIDTHQPGTDFTDGPNTIQAYFNCVNDNGGVNGHPLKLFVQLDQTQPAQITAAAHKLIQSDHVVAIDGVFDLL